MGERSDLSPEDRIGKGFPEGVTFNPGLKYVGAFKGLEKHFRQKEPG